MTLYDLFGIITGSTTVSVYNLEFELLARYDGRDSIPKKYNGCKVDSIFPIDSGVLNVILCID